MRLLQRVLPTLRQIKKPQQKFVAHLGDFCLCSQVMPRCGI